MPILSAIILLLGFPPFDLFFVSWLALVPLLLSIVPGEHWRNAFRGYVAGVVFFALLVWWLNYVTTAGYILLVLYLALYFAFVCWFLGLFRSDATRALLLPPLWVSLEFFRSSGIFAFSWGLLGHSQYNNLPTLQLVSWTGVYGVSALLAATAAALGYLRLRPCQGRFRIRPAHGIVVVVVIVNVLGLWSLSDRPEADELAVGLLQGNVPQLLKWEQGMEDPTIRLYTGMTEDALKQGAELVVWPETAVPDVLDWNPDWEMLFKRLCEKHQCHLLFGALHHNGDSARYYNSAYHITPESASSERDIERYDKMRLVPFGEYVPFRHWIPFVQQVVESEGGGFFSAGTRNIVFSLGSVSFSSLICFESTMPPVARASVRSGARALIVLTNDEWFGRTPASLQHGIQSVFRAVENRVPVVRSTNTGWTCSIDAFGRVRVEVPRFQQKALVDRVSIPRHAGTLYTRWGDWFAWLCVLFVVVITAVTMRRRRVRT